MDKAADQVTPQIEPFYDARTNTMTYVVWDPVSRDAIVIDPVLDYDPASSRVWLESIQRVIAFLREHQLVLHWVLETHAHADHLSASRVLKEKLPNVRVAVGAGITRVQQVFKSVFDFSDDFPTDGRQFDRLLHDGEVLQAGTLAVSVIATPGHTPACTSFRIADAVFTGDALFMPDSGTGRCDFPDGSATQLYHSIMHRLYALPENTQVFVGHDYQPNGRALAFVSTIGEQKRHNIHVRADTTEDAFVSFRTQRDKTLAAPRLLLPSIQININAGILPAAARNQRRYLKLPLDTSGLETT